ncbi:MAG: sigma 54-interacting transcriptional regulator [Novosphingobium sp.]|nr:sigma 54-interacting transcriptional regulator [Novosphingobium sp.]
MRVGYRDPLSESALGKLVAAMAGKHDALAVDPESLSVFALAERIAKSDVPVLINGPTGTGKEVLSRFIHARSARADGPFVAVNCAAMPETMLEAMLFGHQKGAFTGANAASEGFMRAADGGTLLLDEIAEMPLPLQAKLLRALQEQEVVPIGSTMPVKIDVRIIACANRDLPFEVSEGRFRADLFYRLNVFPLTLPPLAQRPADIPMLAYAMALRHAEGDAPALSDEAVAMLSAHAWPGNVRELENVIRRALLLANGADTIGAEHIVFDRPVSLVGTVAPGGLSAMPRAESATPEADLASIVRKSEADAIVQALADNNGNRLRTAAALGISERTLRYRLAAMRDAGIEVRSRAAGGLR